MPHEVFISYARSDNVAEGNPLGGWVTRFRLRLIDRLSMVTGRKVLIYLDEAEHELDSHLSEITKTKIRDAHVLVCVLTQGFTQRTWCEEEVLAFLGRRRPAVFHAEKLPPDDEHRDRLPEPIRRIPSTAFWEPTPPRNNPLEFPDSSEDYRRRINDLAHAIAARLPAVGEPGRTQRSVYVARTPPELQPARIDLEHELIDQGYLVVPDDLLHDAEAVVKPRIEAALERCALSVHMIGSEPASVPNGGGLVTLDWTDPKMLVPLQWTGPETLVALQWRLGKAVANQCPPVVWFPKGTVAVDPGQIALTASIEKNPAGAAVVRGTMADLKQKIRQILEPPNAPGPGPAPALPNGPGPRPAPSLPAPTRTLYLMTDLSDDEGVDEVVQHAHKAHTYVMMLPKDGTQRDRTELHAEYLSTAERALLFWGNASQAWVQKKLVELNKVPSMRNRPRGAFLRGSKSFAFPPGVDVLHTLSDVDRFLGGSPPPPAGSS